ncbi:glycosyltransferase [Bacillus sp. sid0103]|uniref:glycosyltransferase n=1 Tax=Bacillus sp. sid0103 TaxID=2856337 RepID=UPI001C4524E8|nr:glycosyltransferase [Bacillus sp. sid0103]MBV7508972.1 glycosyltransferase [Bacillus sp. sid0103]
MPNSTIKYIGFYDSDTYAEENRNSFLAATNKMDYICQAIVASGSNVEIISPSWTTNKKGFYQKRSSTIGDGVTLTCGPTFGANRRILRYLRILLSWIWLFGYLVKNTNSKETIIAYHSMMIINPIMLAKKIKKFKLILEVEEIYQDVKEHSQLMQKNEYSFFQIADSFIFPTELLNEKINKAYKPHTIIYGTYKVEQERKSKFNDGRIHCVYAGTFDPRKGGSIAATVAPYLSKNYHIHIIGFGSEEETSSIKKLISEIAKTSDCTITYDGLLKGEEYIRFLQSCHIGLSTQISDAKYNNTSFPSKILSYMANGLRVVSVRIKAIEISAIGDIINFYEEQTPKAIAEAIMSIDINKLYDSKKLIKKLDEKFVHSLKKMLEN